LLERLSIIDDWEGICCKSSRTWKSTLRQFVPLFDDQVKKNGNFGAFRKGGLPPYYQYLKFFSTQEIAAAKVNLSYGLRKEAQREQNEFSFTDN